MSPRVFTVPASAPFLPTVLAALVDGRLVAGFPGARDPLALAQATLYLPTRRACRLARDLFLDALGGEASILPRIVALGDIDEDEIAFAEAATGAVAAEALALPPALGGLERKLLLGRLVLQWAASPDMRGEAGAPLIASTPAAALALADDLARLMDDMSTRQVSWNKLDHLVPDHLDEYWQLTLKFLKIVRNEWPRILAERGAIEPAARRDQLIAAEAGRLARTDAPVIAAGSTGSMPATAALLATIARLPRGAVVLPGLDTDLDDASWKLIGGKDGSAAAAFGHPQFAMQALLDRLEISRDAVARLAEPTAHGRELFISEALRPAESTEIWQRRLVQPEFAAHADAALAGLTMIDAANAEDEALAVAVVLRQAAEDPKLNAAFVTPDRSLARRVLAALARWNVPVDDSGGDVLADTPAGVFARLAAEAALGGLAPVPLLAVLKHPLFRLGNAQAVSAIERSVLRGPRPRAGSIGIAQALTSFQRDSAKLHHRDPRSLVGAEELKDAADLVARLAAALVPLESLSAKPIALGDIAARHHAVVAALSAEAAFAGNACHALAEALDELADVAGAHFMLMPADYPDFFRTALRDRIIRRPETSGVRVRIFGPLEARLQNIDLVVLGGLVEGTWPPQTRSDAWLSRPMRQTLGLDLPERRTGLSAHDFAQALGAREVILTRASKLAGAPTLPSRFVQRLAAVAGSTRWKEVCARGQKYLDLARLLDTPARVTRVLPPAPKPPRDARPVSLSVTEIEHWLRDPYTIYAKHILRLLPLDAVDTPPGARDRGIVIHEAIGEFTRKFTDVLPADAAGELIALGKKHFSALDAYPEARAFWWPRFERVARWLATFEAQRRRRVKALHGEIGGKLDIAIGGRSFRLTARADRIERLADDSYAILDYKTGTPPSVKQVRIGFAPQLTLEAAMLRGGGFGTIPAGGSVSELVYLALKGGEPAGERKLVEFEDGVPDAQADYAISKLKAIVSRFEDEQEPYRSLVHPMWKGRYGEYDHLARVKEWSATGGAADDDGGGE